MTPGQCSAARALLGWSRYRLEGMSELREGFIRVYETSGRASAGYTESGAERIAAAREAFEAAGIEFATGDGDGVTLRKFEL